MKTMRSSILCFVVLLLAGPLLRAQDLSKYRHFTIGMSMTRVLERTGQKMADVKLIHGRPALVQELNWWPPNLPGISYQSDTVEQILFSFYNGELYKISVTYDRSSTEGLTEEDMVKSISAKYGPPTYVCACDRLRAERRAWRDANARRVLGGRAIFLQSCPFFLHRSSWARHLLQASQCRR